jgi:hypothetical protein
VQCRAWDSNPHGLEAKGFEVVTAMRMTDRHCARSAQGRAPGQRRALASCPLTATASRWFGHSSATGALRGQSACLAVEGRASLPCRSLEKDGRRVAHVLRLPVEHWKHLRTSNVIESPFATVRMRQRVTKGAGSRTKEPLMAYKLLDMAQARWRRLDGAHLLPLVRAGIGCGRGAAAGQGQQDESESSVITPYSDVDHVPHDDHRLPQLVEQRLRVH